MDLLSNILSALKLRGSLYFRTDLSAPWGLDVPAHENVARFHVVVNGSCWIHVGEDDETPAIPLAEGDLAIVPHGSRHQLLEQPTSSTVTVDDVIDETAFDGLAPLVYGGDGPTTTLVCGHFGFDEGVLHPLLDALPAIIQVRADETKNYAWLAKALEFIALEAGSPAPGSDAIVERISEILFIQVIRGYLEHGGRDRVVLAGLADDRIAGVLRAIHERPAHPWKVEDLARLAAMSRTAFAVRFSDLMGLTPMEYVTRWRLQKAHAFLAETTETVGAIAERVGYASEASFSKVFKRYYGRGPGAVRRAH